MLREGKARSTLSNRILQLESKEGQAKQQGPVKKTGQIRTASKASRECSSAEAEATRTSVREPKAEAEMRRERPAQWQIKRPFVRTAFETTWWR